MSNRTMRKQLPPIIAMAVTFLVIMFQMTGYGAKLEAATPHRIAAPSLVADLMPVMP